MIPFISTSLHNRLEKELSQIKEWLPVYEIENDIFKCYFVKPNKAQVDSDATGKLVATNMYMKSITEENAILHCFLSCAEDARNYKH